MAFDSQGEISDHYISATTDQERELLTRLAQTPGLPGYLKQLRGPARRTNLAVHSDFADFATAHPGAKAFLAAPIFARGELVGSLCLVEQDGDSEFTDEDQAIAATFAAQAGSTIANARRYEEARQASADYETLLQICPVGISVYDTRSGEITFSNQESRRLVGMLGLPDDELGNIFLALKFTRPDGREMGFEDFPGTRVLQSGEAVIADEIIVHRADGTTLPTLVNCSPVFSATGEMVAALTVMQDITPLQDPEPNRADFLEMVSEELRTPLISIKGSAAALKSISDPRVATEEIQLLRIIDEQADLMRSQINSLIELAQIESGTLPLVAEPTNVARLIEWSCEEYSQEHDAIAVQLDVADDLPSVLADTHRIGKVLHNLIRQAARHVDESSPVVVSAVIDNIHVAISVSAPASSASPDKVSLPVNTHENPHLHSMVTQAYTKAATLSSGGEGLALAFCRGVVEAHGGRIRTDIDEELGRLTLTFTLPSVDEAPEPESHAASTCESLEQPLPAPIEKPQILVSIEDPRLLRSVREVLLDSDYGAVTTSNLDEVEELAASGRPKLIVLDITGREDDAFRILRGTGNSRNLPAIVLCERDDEEYVVRAFEMGADGYMLKPFSPSELVARISATLRRLNGTSAPVRNHTFQSGAVRIDFNQRTVDVSGQPVQLTATEYRLLEELANGAGRVFTQDMLLHRVWGPEYSGESQLLRSYIKSLRQKLGDNARKPTYIFTEHGVGYRMARAGATADHPGLASSTA